MRRLFSASGRVVAVLCGILTGVCLLGACTARPSTDKTGITTTQTSIHPAEEMTSTSQSMSKDELGITQAVNMTSTSRTSLLQSMGTATESGIDLFDEPTTVTSATTTQQITVDGGTAATTMVTASRSPSTQSTATATNATTTSTTATVKTTEPTISGWVTAVIPTRK